MKKNIRIFIIAGEKSGDELGGALIHELKKIYNNIEFLGIGGNKMISQGLNSIINMKLLSIMGITEVLLKIPRILKLLKLTEKEILKFNPDILITIDSPGFNLRLQNKLKYIDMKRVHYVAPSVWAWKSYRAKQMSKYLDLLLVLFPFEKKFFIKEGLSTVFVGHPIAYDNKYLKNEFYNEKSLNNQNILKIALLPGSRLSEIKKLFPIFIETAKMLRKKNNAIKFYVVTLKEYKNIILEMFKKSELNYYVTDNMEEKYNIYTKVDFALCASGTVTMELAKASTPMLVVYKLNYITWIIVRLMVKVKTATILNLVLEKNVIPELFQQEVNSNTIFNVLNNYLTNKELIKEHVSNIKIAVNKIKNNDNPSILSANSILNLLK